MRGIRGAWIETIRRVNDVFFSTETAQFIYTPRDMHTKRDMFQSENIRLFLLVTCSIVDYIRHRLRCFYKEIFVVVLCPMFFLRMSISNNVKVVHIRILARNRECSSSTRTKQDSQFSLFLLSLFLINVSLYYVGNNEVSSITNERKAQYLISKMAG